MVQAKQIAAAALGLLSVPTIPYVAAGASLQGMDCQGLVKYCAKRNGLTLAYKGSNDMFRNACSAVYSLADARKAGVVKPGAVCFILDRDGAEPDQYKRDGLGNASHVGVVTLAREAWSVDASASAGRVRARDERNAKSCWTHIGLLKSVNYNEPGEDEDTTLSDGADSRGDGERARDSEPLEVAPVGGRARVNADPTLTFRKEPRVVPGVDNRVPPCPRIPMFADVETLERRGDWTRVKYKGYIGWVMSMYLDYDDSPRTGAGREE
jgi:hypothetical protein